MGQPVIVSACRTPIGKFQGCACHRSRRRSSDRSRGRERPIRSAPGSPREARSRTSCSATSCRPGLGQNPARQGASCAQAFPTRSARSRSTRSAGVGSRRSCSPAQAIKAGDLTCARRRRHGVDDQRSVLPAAGAWRTAARSRQVDRRHGPRRVVGHLQRLPHGV